MKKILFIIVLMVTVIGLKAQTLQNQKFEKANYYYNEARYDTAVIIYESILNDGYVSAPLLYNIGNAYFKMREYPMAILNYEKALKIEPDNNDIKQNLAIANALITDKIEPVPEFFLTKLWKNIGDKLSANEWATLSLVLIGLVLIVLFLYLTARTKGVKKSMFFIGILLIVICLCSIIHASQKHRYMNEHNEAIVMIPTITVKSSPTTSGTDLFVLHEGTKVSVLDKDDSWNKIKIADGSVGWLPSSCITKY
jgi:tetratricopeptide (TPR) repeat protein